MPSTGFLFDSPDFHGVQPRVLTGSSNTRTRAGVSRCGGHNNWVLDYTFTHGGRYKTISTGRRWRERLPATGHLYPPGTYYWEEAAEADLRIESAWIIFSGGELVGMEKMVLLRDSLAHFDDPEGVLGRLLLKINQGTEGEALPAFFEAQQVFYAILLALSRAERHGEGRYRIATEGKDRLPLSLGRRVDHFLREHLQRRLTLADLANLVNLSESGLSHRYREETGATPMDALTDIRVDEVKKLLMMGLSLKEIAPRTGFYDEFHLSRTFKKKTGITPSGFRKAFQAPPLT